MSEAPRELEFDCPGASITLREGITEWPARYVRADRYDEAIRQRDAFRRALVDIGSMTWSDDFGYVAASQMKTRAREGLSAAPPSLPRADVKTETRT